MDIESLDIIIPCYNPPLGWEKELHKNFSSLSSELSNISLILINDGSTKNFNKESLTFLTKKIPSINYITYSKNKGKGYALRCGVLKSNSKHIIFTDIDFPYQQTSIISTYLALKTGADVALGSRDSNYYSKTPAFRMVISKTFRYLLKLFLNLKATDTQCGLKGFNKKGKEEFLKTTIDRFLFDLEFVKRCSQRKDLKIKAIPVTLKEGVIFSQMNFKILAGEFLNFLMVLIKR